MPSAMESGNSTAGPIALLNGLLRRTDVWRSLKRKPRRCIRNSRMPSLGTGLAPRQSRLESFRLCENTYGDLAMILNRSLAEILSSVAWLLVVPRSASLAPNASSGLCLSSSKSRPAPPSAWVMTTSSCATSALKSTPGSRAKRRPGCSPARGGGGRDSELRTSWPRSLRSGPRRGRESSRTTCSGPEHRKAQGHAGAAITFNRVYVDGPDRTIDVKGNANHIDPALHLANILLSEITGICGEALGLEELRDLFPRRS